MDTLIFLLMVLTIAVAILVVGLALYFTQPSNPTPVPFDTFTLTHNVSNPATVAKFRIAFNTTGVNPSSPTASAVDTNITVNWGDETIETITIPYTQAGPTNVTHTYSSAGDYTVTVTSDKRGTDGIYSLNLNTSGFVPSHLPTATNINVKTLNITSSSITNLFLDSPLLTSIEKTLPFQLITLSLSNNTYPFESLIGPTIINMYIINKNLTTLDTTNLTSLTYLNCSNNQITVLDVTNLTNLTEIYCNNNQIAVLDVTNLTNLTSIDCNNNQIAVLDVTNLTQLSYLNCEVNSIAVLDVSNLTQLSYLNCSNNQITVLDVTNLTNLNEILCGDNLISTLAVANLDALNFIRCINNNIDQLSAEAIATDLLPHTVTGDLDILLQGATTLTKTGSLLTLESQGWNVF